MKIKTELILAFLLTANCYLMRGASIQNDSVTAIMEKVADWQIQQYPYIKHSPLSWTNGPFYLGLVKLNEISQNDKYINFLIDVGNSNDWKLNERENKYFADDFCVAQFYLEVYKKTGIDEIIKPLVEKVDYTIENPSNAQLWLGGEKGQERWSWCDALFMAPPVYAGLYVVTGNKGYAEFLDKEFIVCVDSLFDRSANLFYRDRNYKDRIEPNGEKVFWGRGNGWALGGIASVLNYLPRSHKNYGLYVDVFKKMAGAVLKCQNENGYWQPSMLDPNSYPDQENSATGLLTYGLAWGINNGILEESVYKAPVMKAWGSMVRCVSPEGKLGYIQKVGQRPEKIDKDSTEIYGVGAFLLAGSEINKLLMRQEYQIQYFMDIAKKNALLANEGFLRPYRYVHDWLEYVDSTTGLIPRNLQNSIDLWDQKDVAADNYPYMVITASLTDKMLFKGRMLDILKTETELTSRIGNLPDEYSFSKHDFLKEEIDTGRIIFGSSEYVKDGLMVVTEWLGNSPWSDRMIAILDDLWKIAPVKAQFGNIVSDDNEINGEMLQVLSRIYWMTGEERYLDYAIRLGDYYLLGNHHPTRDMEKLRLRDHGCEIISGLTELYAAVHFARPEKKEIYQKPLYEMLDRILEVGRNNDGLFYDDINPKTGEIITGRIADTFGYTFNGYYIVYQLDGVERYRDVVIQALEKLNEKYRNYNWENFGVDGYADAVEGALNLYNREPLQSVKEWIDSEIKVMWNFQDNHPGPRGEGWANSGIIEGMHPDGNFARTSLMYALWKTQGVKIEPWRKDVYFGAVENNGNLMLYIASKDSWKGKVFFDCNRHKTHLNLPYDWPRINQFQEWFIIEEGREYEFFEINENIKTKYYGSELNSGIELNIKGGEKFYLIREKIE